MRWETVEQPRDQFYSWLGGILRSAPPEMYVHIKSESPGHIQVHIYTEEHNYLISATYPADICPAGYLGCVVVARKARAGEDHHRGNDLSDGPFEESTWNSIVRDIVAYELVKLAPPTFVNPLGPIIVGFPAPRQGGQIDAPMETGLGPATIQTELPIQTEPPFLNGAA